MAYADPWQDQGKCRETGGDIFYPEKGEQSREPREVCKGCPVRMKCLESALAHNERFGVWGGLTPRERRRLQVMSSTQRSIELRDLAADW